MICSHFLSRRRAAVVPLICAPLLVFAGSAYAKVIKTDKGTPVKNWDAQVRLGKDVLVKESGGGADLAISGYKPFTQAKSDEITDADKTDFPGIVVDDNASPIYDCHGYTFKNKNTWIDNDQVQTILDDQGWTPNPPKAKVGDVVVYKKDGKITHTGKVTAVNPDGSVKTVQSKWGSCGLYSHAIDNVPASYGTATVYTGGKVLKDPPGPISADLQSFFVAHPVDIKDSQLVTLGDDMPVPTFTFDDIVGNQWNYELDFPTQGLFVTSGDQVTLYAQGGIIGGGVSGPASSYFTLLGFTGNSITWIATASSFVPTNLLGFYLLDSMTTGHGAFYQETISGSDARTFAPGTPEPAALAPFAIGTVLMGLMAVRRRRPAGDPAVSA